MVYQTDSAPIYSSKSGRPSDIARLRGQFQSGAKGEYEIVTIRPGKEPREIFEFFFAGGPLLSGKEKGIVLQPRKDANGVWIAVQHFDLGAY